MKKIERGIVFSEDIKRILNGINAFDFKYDFVPSNELIRELRSDFKSEVKEIFNNEVTIISEDEMLEINNLVRMCYPHCNIG